MRFKNAFIPTLKRSSCRCNYSKSSIDDASRINSSTRIGNLFDVAAWLRCDEKIMQIIREEMDAIGGQEFHLPSLNPIEIWEETGRVEAFGDILFQIKIVLMF